MALFGYILAFPIILFVCVKCENNLQIYPSDYNKDDNVTIFNVGVILISESGTPYDIERAGVAVEMAFEWVNRELLNSSYMINPVQRKYGPNCDAASAPGKPNAMFTINLKKKLISVSRLF